MHLFRLFFHYFFINLSGISWIPVIISVILIAVTSTFLGLFIAVSVNEIFEAQTFSNFFRFPMIFLCGLFIPLTQMPAVIRPLSFVLPLTYGVDILKTAINNDGYIPMRVSFIVLIAFGLFLFLFSIRNVKRKWII